MRINMKDFHTLEDLDLKEKTVLLRVDINCPLDKGTLQIINDSRIRRIVPTVRELMGKKAKVVILAHQSRKGKWDFIPMEQHSKRLSEHLNHCVQYVNDIIGNDAKERIRSLSAGDVLMLENVRGLECETLKLDMNGHADSELVNELVPFIDYYICDAFGAAHRSQCSLVGFPVKVRSASGRLMAKEIYALRSIFGEPRRPSVFVLGGAKFGDVSPMIDHVLGSNTADTVILTGLAGNAFLSARGVDLGPGSMEFLKEEMTPENVNAAKDMMTRYGQRILLPADVAVERNGKRVNVRVGDLPVPEAALDIGDDSIEKFGKVLTSSRTSFMSGPAGLYEKEGFGKGTKELMMAMTESKGQSVIGGGHTIGAADMFDMTDGFSYVSTAGGALETFLLGKELPAVEALRYSFKKF
ncbi:MAG: phosphoglycerate kinase [Methanomassiliicoccaceae archaeon]|nr:phosphoglycerate kinase [Methanomassiliicoccaceae archaeon]